MGETKSGVFFLRNFEQKKKRKRKGTKECSKRNKGMFKGELKRAMEMLRRKGLFVSNDNVGCSREM